MKTRSTCKQVMPRSFTGLLALAILLALSGGVTGCDLFRSGDEEPRGGEVVWTFTLTEDIVENTRPLIKGGRVFVPADGKVRAFNLDDGTLLWTVPVRGPNAIGSRSPLIGEGRLYLNDINLVHAIDLESGNVVWRTRIESFSGFGGSVMAQDATHLFFGGRGEVVRLRKSDGIVDLRIPVVQLAPEGVTMNARSPAISEDGMLYVPAGYYRDGAPATEGNLLVYDAETGAYQWGYAIPNRRVKPPSAPDSIVIDAAPRDARISDELIVSTAGQSIIALDRHTGELRWEQFFENDGFDVGLAIDDGRAYVGSLGTNVYAFDLQTGDVLWKRPDTRGSITTILTVTDGRVYFCNESGGQIWVLDKETGRVIWHGFPPEYPEDDFATYLSPLAVGEGYMVNVGSKKIYALRVP